MQLISCSKCNELVYTTARTIEIPFMCFMCRVQLSPQTAAGQKPQKPQTPQTPQTPQDCGDSNFAPVQPPSDDTSLLIENLQKQLESTKTALDRMRVDLRATESAYRVLNAENVNFQRDKTEQSNQIVILLGELEDSRIAREEAEHYEARSIGIVVKALVDVQTLEKKLAVYEGRIRVLETEAVTRIEEIEHLQDHIKMERDLSIKRQEEIDRLKTDGRFTDVYLSELYILKATLEKKNRMIDSLQKDITCLQNENDILHSQTANATRMASYWFRKLEEGFALYMEEATKTWFDKLIGR